nr:hypothetical protein [Halomicroarcula sp. SHR3]
MQSMGAIFVAAMLAIPVAAETVVGGFKRSVVGGQIATLSGVSLSYSSDLTAGGAVVLVAIGIVGVVRHHSRARYTPLTGHIPPVRHRIRLPSHTVI